MNNVEFWTIAGSPREGLIFTFAPEPRNIPAAKVVVEKFKAAGYDPEDYTLYTYAAIRNMAAAPRRPRALTTRQLLHGCARQSG
jgi:branched-chain amino acid transport system substrate-binding protein